MNKKNLTATNLVKAKLAENNYTQEQVAKLLNISLSCFSDKLHNRRDFKASEISNLCCLLNITNKDPYFFAKDVAKTDTLK